MYLPFDTCEQRAWIVEYIAKREGYYVSGSLPMRYNNPGSLRYVGQSNASRGKFDFAIFDSPLEGWQSLERDLSFKRQRNARLQKSWKYLKIKTK